jgi:hypothetical protein
MARRDPMGIRLLTRRGNDWSARFPLIVEAVNHLKVGSCLIDGEVECCDERGFLRQRRSEACAFFAFDLLELDGTDMRREPIEVRKATLASILGKRRPGARLNEHLEHPDGALVFAHACKLGVEGIVEATGVAISVGPVAGLAQVQEPACSCGEAGRKRIGAGEVRAMPQICRSSHYNYAERRSIVLRLPLGCPPDARSTVRTRRGEDHRQAG